MAKKVIKKKPPRKVVYVGPTLKRGLLRQYAVFWDGEYPASIQELRNKSPAVRGLFLPVESLTEARRRVRTKGDLLNTFVSRIQKELGG